MISDTNKWLQIYYSRFTLERQRQAVPEGCLQYRHCYLCYPNGQLLPIQRHSAAMGRRRMHYLPRQPRRSDQSDRRFYLLHLRLQCLAQGWTAAFPTMKKSTCRSGILPLDHWKPTPTWRPFWAVFKRQPGGCYSCRLHFKPRGVTAQREWVNKSPLMTRNKVTWLRNYVAALTGSCAITPHNEKWPLWYYPPFLG